MEKKSCCSPGPSKQASNIAQSTSLKGEIRKRYGELAKAQGGSCGCTAQATTDLQGGSCCETSSCNLNPGYSIEDIQSLPEKAVSASAGCGNPTALAGLKEGETVLDLGSGGGIDVFIAAKKVGSKGKAIGVDMTPEMIDLARSNASQSGLDNVEFRLGEIEHLPVADGSVDVIISNCVINLSTDKDAVFKEAYRVLKKGGRILVSDVMAEGLPKEVREDLTSWAQCVGGALALNDYTNKIKAAGFKEVDIVSNSEYSKEFITDSISSMNDIDKDLLKNIEGVKVSHAEISARKT